MSQLEKNLIAYIRAKLLKVRFTEANRRDVIDALRLLFEIRRAG